MCVCVCERLRIDLHPLWCTLKGRSISFDYRFDRLSDTVGYRVVCLSARYALDKGRKVVRRNLAGSTFLWKLWAVERKREGCPWDFWTRSSVWWTFDCLRAVFAKWKTDWSLFLSYDISWISHLKMRWVVELGWYQTVVLGANGNFRQAQEIAVQKKV